MFKTSFIPFVLGVAVGILGVIFVPGYVRPYLPDWALGKQVVVQGTVTAKQKKDAALLVTVNTPEGVLLATFTRKIDEINLLVNEKDELEFNLPKYMPFIEDPTIIRVVKEQPAAPGPAPEVKPAGKGVKEVKPGSTEKPRTSTEDVKTMK
jgi:hypothetical protein